MMTWRELGDAIAALPQEVQDSWALVWVPGDVPVETYDEFATVIALSPFSADEPISDDNPVSISLFQYYSNRL